MQTSENTQQRKFREFPRLLKNSLDGRFHPKSDTNRHQTRCFWGYWSPICGRYQFNADFFNRLERSRKSVCKILYKPRPSGQVFLLFPGPTHSSQHTM
jgi:hypothetical protein